MTAINRRRLLIGGGALLLLGRVRWDADPFALGVASGEPTASSVVLWTRLATAPATRSTGSTRTSRPPTPRTRGR